MKTNLVEFDELKGEGFFPFQGFDFSDTSSNITTHLPTF